MIEITSGRANPHIDPHLSIWEWQIPGYLFLGGLVAGLMIFNGLWRLLKSGEPGKSCTFHGPLLAPILLSVGMFLLFLDLSYKMHVYKFYTTFQIRSPMSWGSWILLFVYPVQIFALALPGGIRKMPGMFDFLDPLWSKLQDLVRNREKGIAIANIVLGAGLGIYTGILLSAFAARPLWNTSLLAPLFLVSGLSAGAALILLLKPSPSEHKFLLNWDIGLLITEFMFIALIVISLLTGTGAHKEAAHLILGGPFTAVFWVFVVGIGIFLTIWLEWREISERYVPLWLAPLLVLTSGLILRFVIVLGGQHSYL